MFVSQICSQSVANLGLKTTCQEVADFKAYKSMRFHSQSHNVYKVTLEQPSVSSEPLLTHSRQSSERPTRQEDVGVWIVPLRDGLLSHFCTGTRQPPQWRSPLSDRIDCHFNYLHDVTQDAYILRTHHRVTKKEEKRAQKSSLCGLWFESD